MKRLIVIALMLALVIGAGLLTIAQGNQSSDKAAIKAAVLDYVEGIYEIKPERIERSVDVTLRKYGFGMNREKKEYYNGSEMNFKQLRRLAANWNKDNKRVDPATGQKDIVILDMLDKTASAKLTAMWGIDYFHLAKEDGKWKIINVLWQSHPPSENQM